MISLIVNLWAEISKGKKIEFIKILAFMILSSISEIISISALIPFLDILINKNKEDYILINEYLSQIDYIINREIAVTIIFIIITIIATTLKIEYLKKSTKYAFSVGEEFANEIFKKTIYQEYEVIVKKNTSEIINILSIKLNGFVYSIILPLLILLNSIILSLAIVVGLLIINYKITIISTILLGSMYIYINTVTRRKLIENSEIISKNQNNLIRNLQETLGGIRHIILDSTHNIFIKNNKKIDKLIRDAQSKNLIISNCPKYFIEAIGISLISILAFSHAENSEELIKIIPVVGVFALAAQKILPVLQQGFSAISSIYGNKETLEQILKLKNEKIKIIEKEEIIKFEDEINIAISEFKYENEQKNILSKINISIKKGKRIGIIGNTGSGKSTFVDLLIGIIKSENCVLKLDDEIVSDLKIKSWQKIISHVPQNIYLTDATIAENIAFGIEKNKIDREKIKIVSEKAQLADFIETLNNKYETIVGERGVRLSGGQKQRIGIARALYKDSKVIIFDEATSALDDHTENYIMQTIRNLEKNITIILIAHRTSTLKECEEIYRIKDEEIQKIGSYEDFINDKE